ncbi:MAG TPA: MarR family transcriptional regulator [Solirubrobacteraceae bacterium]|nr:MarR family transcriptional regulator [Solirubrobacteraceae bacterium]
MGRAAQGTLTTSEEQSLARSSGELEPTARLRAAVGRLSRRLRPTVAGSGLTPSQTSVLFTIVRSGPLRLSDVAELEALNPTMLSRFIGQLTDAGLIRRTADPGDRRAALVEATSQGRRLRERIHRERTRALETYVDELDESQREILWRALPVLEELAERLPARRP